MHSISTSTAAAGGKWGSTAKAVAMGTAGTVLWGSLAYYFVVGAGVSDMVADGAPAEKVYFRTELAEKDLLRGCSLNNGAGECDGDAWIILSQHVPRTETPKRPEALKAALPQPLWEDMAARNAMTDAACNAMVSKELPGWLATVPRAQGAMTVALVPQNVISCQPSTNGPDAAREHRTFWFIDGDKVVARMRCSVPGTYMDPACEFAAYPEHGTYTVSYSRLPAGNVERMVQQAPNMLGALEASLPDELTGVVDLAVVRGPFAVDAATSNALADFGSVLN